MAGEIADAAHTALSYWEELGAALVEISLPDMSLARSAALTIQLPEALSYHRPILAKSDHLYGDVARPLLVAGQFILAEHYVQAQRIARAYCDAVNAFFDEVDAIVTPGTPIAAPAIGTTKISSESEEIPVGTALTRLTGLVRPSQSLFNLIEDDLIIEQTWTVIDGMVIPPHAWSRCHVGL